MSAHRRLRHLHAALIVPIAAGATLVTTTPAGATSIRTIGPNQSFVGVVHGLTGTNKLLMLCPGPASFGHPAAGQTVSVVPGDVIVGGFTGRRGNHIAVSFPGPSTAGAVNVYAYGVPVAIPTTLTLPCGTTGIVRFTPLPAARNARTDLVPVLFEPGPAVAPGTTPR